MATSVAVALLYWLTKEGDPPSPFGPLVSRARKEGYVKGTSEPYHGYVYKILTAQGKDAAAHTTIWSPAR